MSLSDPAGPRATGDTTPAGDPDDVTRQRLLALLESEIGKAAADALARGTDPGSLAAYVDSRAALLRAEIAAASAAREDGADRGDDTA
ncbi:hypothetical protein [Catellatospora bangladeshensis]|uniref:Uncharacterized protein n=1 Tax=Catellatospora bangladeshensis TaxID=310355 RepID=A0A8J3JMC0_9ACTN|nr:hypothetical protein [Catellatospora bangladeshensis]GIF85124.1 hypothetical protein Cba03nite_64730 [Catellatospora bangladeshensis]